MSTLLSSATYATKQANTNLGLHFTYVFNELNPTVVLFDLKNLKIYYYVVYFNRFF